ncbi:MAG: patatin-like phospholipase family protein [Bacteroidota bacterium]|nr:patatin-like phospholipase family protein [Bacteroidota bacterium]
MRRYLTLLIVLLLIASIQTNAQKVALVLSGGGAKGLAHVGVIKALEENGIPIDYIAGTSMGAIVGALYAAGYSAEQMEALFKSKEFKLWSTGKIEEDKVYFFKRKSDNAAWLNINLRPKSEKLEVAIPTNIIPEAQMDFAFMELFSAVNAACNYDFNKLFVPFRSVATDVYNRNQVVGRNGDLGEEVRASMTFPFYFKPIEINGVLLFDGGIVNNFPVDVAMTDFKPDFIIGHTVANNPGKPDPDNVVAQLENMIMGKTNYNIPKDKGFLLETKFINVELMDFQKIDFIEQEGYLTAKQNMDSLKRQITRRVSKEEVEQRRTAYKSTIPRMLFHNITVEGVTDNMKKKYIIQSIKHKAPIVSIDEVRDAYYKLISDDQIRSMRPVSKYNKETGFFDLTLKVKSTDPLEVLAGGNVSSQGITEGFIGLNYKSFKDRAYTASGNVYFGKFYSSFNSGLRVDIPAHNPLYLNANITFNNWDYYSSSSDIFFSDSHPTYILQDERNFIIDAGMPTSTNSLFEFGLAHSNSIDHYFQTQSFKKADEPDRTIFDAFNFHLKFEYNSLNDKQYPTRGLQRIIEGKFVTGNEKYSPGTTAPDTDEQFTTHTYEMFRFKYDKYFPISSKVTLGVLAEALLSNKKTFSNYLATIAEAPAFTPNPHSKTIFIDKFRANNYIAAGGKGIFPIKEKLHVRLEGYYFIPIRKIMQTEDYKAKYSDIPLSDKYFMGSCALVNQTPFGPASISLNYYEKDGSKFYFLFNFGYILFNRKGL